MLLNCGVGEDSWESLGLQGDPTSPFWRRSALGFLWKEWCWSWNSSTLATSCEELTHWKRLWCWEELGAGGEGDDRGWDGWMASLTRRMWVWVNSRSWWWTGGPGVLRFMGSQRVGHDWATELNWISIQHNLEHLKATWQNFIFWGISKVVSLGRYKYNTWNKTTNKIYCIINSSHERCELQIIRNWKGKRNVQTRKASQQQHYWHLRPDCGSLSCAL